MLLMHNLVTLKNIITIGFTKNIDLTIIIIAVVAMF